MKKHILIFLVFTFLVCISLSTKAQTNTFPSSGSVGIGTPAPSNKLEIKGAANQLKLTAAIAGQEVSMLFSPGGTLNAWQSGINSTVNGWFLYENTANAYRMVVKQGGNVGIGTTSPMFKLDVVGQVASGYTYLDNTIDVDNGYTRSNFGSNVYWNQTNNTWEVRTIGNNDFSAMIHPNGDGLAFITAASTGNVARSLTNAQFMANEKMRINANGSVGIGTTNPLSYSKLDVRGGALNVVNYATNGYGYIGRNADPGNHDSYLYHVISANYHIIGSSKNGMGAIKKLGFALGSTDTESDIKMTIDNTGNVGIGTTTPIAKLQVSGWGLFSSSSNPTSAALVRNNTAFSTAATPDFTWYNNDQTGIFHPANNIIALTTGGVEKIRINNEGTLSTYVNHGSGDWGYGIVCKINGTTAVNRGRTKAIAVTDYVSGTDQFIVWGDGLIHAKEIKVTVGSFGHPDYVFSNDYQLMPIDDLKSYLNKNKHLPGIPSAEEIKNNDGISLGEMSEKNLEKIEELYLYMLQLHDEIQQLRRENKNLNSIIEEIKK